MKRKRLFSGFLAAVITMTSLQLSAVTSFAETPGGNFLNDGAADWGGTPTLLIDVKTDAGSDFSVADVFGVEFEIEKVKTGGYSGKLSINRATAEPPAAKTFGQNAGTKDIAGTDTGFTASYDASPFVDGDGHSQFAIQCDTYESFTDFYFIKYTYLDSDGEAIGSNTYDKDTGDWDGFELAEDEVATPGGNFLNDGAADWGGTPTLLIDVKTDAGSDFSVADVFGVEFEIEKVKTGGYSGKLSINRATAEPPAAKTFGQNAGTKDIAGTDTGFTASYDASPFVDGDGHSQFAIQCDTYESFTDFYFIKYTYLDSDGEVIGSNTYDKVSGAWGGFVLVEDDDDDDDDDDDETPAGYLMSGASTAAAKQYNLSDIAALVPDVDLAEIKGYEVVIEPATDMYWGGLIVNIGGYKQYQFNQDGYLDNFGVPDVNDVALSSFDKDADSGLTTIRFGTTVDFTTSGIQLRIESKVTQYGQTGGDFYLQRLNLIDGDGMILAKFTVDATGALEVYSVIPTGYLMSGASALAAKQYELSEIAALVPDVDLAEMKGYEVVIEPATDMYWGGLIVNIGGYKQYQFNQDGYLDNFGVPDVNDATLSSFDKDADGGLTTIRFGTTVDFTTSGIQLRIESKVTQYGQTGGDFYLHKLNLIDGDGMILARLAVGVDGALFIADDDDEQKEYVDVTYEGGGEDGGSKTIKVEKGKTAAIIGRADLSSYGIVIPDGMLLSHWVISGSEDTVEIGENYTFEANVTFTAVWIPKSITNSNNYGGSFNFYNSITNVANDGEFFIYNAGINLNGTTIDDVYGFTVEITQDGTVDPDDLKGTFRQYIRYNDSPYDVNFDNYDYAWDFGGDSDVVCEESDGKYILTFLAEDASLFMDENLTALANWTEENIAGLSPIYCLIFSNESSMPITIGEITLLAADGKKLAPAYTAKEVSAIELYVGYETNVYVADLVTGGIAPYTITGAVFEDGTVASATISADKGTVTLKGLTEGETTVTITVADDAGRTIDVEIELTSIVPSTVYVAFDSADLAAQIAAEKGVSASAPITIDIEETESLTTVYSVLSKAAVESLVTAFEEGEVYFELPDGAVIKLDLSGYKAASFPADGLNIGMSVTTADSFDTATGEAIGLEATDKAVVVELAHRGNFGGIIISVLVPSAEVEFELDDATLWYVDGDNMTAIWGKEFVDTTPEPTVYFAHDFTTMDEVESVDTAKLKMGNNGAGADGKTIAISHGGMYITNPNAPADNHKSAYVTFANSGMVAGAGNKYNISYSGKVLDLSKGTEEMALDSTGPKADGTGTGYNPITTGEIAEDGTFTVEVIGFDLDAFLAEKGLAEMSQIRFNSQYEKASPEFVIYNIKIEEYVEPALEVLTSDEDYVYINLEHASSYVLTDKDFEAEGGDDTVAVTGVTLDKSELTLLVGGEETLNATIAPNNATDKDVTWSSSNEAIATVDENGKVKAVAKGTATITVTTKDGGKTATCTVTVNEVPATGGGDDDDDDDDNSGTGGGGSIVIPPPATVTTDKEGNKTTTKTTTTKDASGNTVTKTTETIQPANSKNEIVIETSKSGSTTTTTVEVAVKDVKGVIKSGTSQIKTDVSSAIALAEKALGDQSAEIKVKLDDNSLLARVNNDKIKEVQIIVEGAQKDNVNVVVSKDVVNKARSLGKEVKIALKDDSGKNSVIWTIDPKGAKDTADVSLSVSAGTASSVKTVDTALAKSKNNSNGVVLSLGSNLPKAANLQVSVTSLVKNTPVKAGQKVYIYKFNEKTKKFEATVQDTATISKAGNVTIKNAESEKYVILAKPLETSLVTPLTKQASFAISKNTVKVGGTSTIKANIPQDIKKVKTLNKNSKDLQVKVTYKSSNPSIATVDANGKVTYLKKGNVKITVTREYSTGAKHSASMTIPVK